MAGLAEATGLLRLLADTNRVRLLALLEQEELTVAELVAVTRLGQSRISTHLARLKEGALVVDRRAGKSSFYKLNDGDWPGEAAEAWALVRRAATDPLLDQDRERLMAVLHARDGGAHFEDSVSGHMERHYLPGRSWEAALRGLLGLMRFGDVLDVGSGDCAVAELLAPRARSITCLDLASAPLRAGRERLARMSHARFMQGDMHRLPFAPASFDQVLLFCCLSYAEDPAQVAREASRLLRPGGALAVITLSRHGHAEIGERYGHRQPGFSEGELSEFFSAAGATVEFCRVTSRERRPPHLEVLTLHATR